MINALMAVLMTVAIPLWPGYVAHAAAAHEESKGVYSGDGPAMLFIAAWGFVLIFFIPSAALLTAASVSMWIGGEHRRVLQVLAILSLIVPAIVTIRFFVMYL
jgi:hypothetical protein